MDIENSILEDRSNENIWRIAHFILDNPENIVQLWRLIEQGSTSVQMRASWVLSKVIEKDALLLDGFMDKALEILSVTRKNGVKRNLLRSIYFSSLKEENYSVLFDLVNSFILSPAQPIAVRMFSMRISFKIVESVPDLSQEFIQVMEAISGSLTSSGLRNAHVELLNKAKKLP